jgi:uncharacterized membrane protein
MSKNSLNISLIGLNALLVFLLLVNIQELSTIFQFLGRLHPLVLHFPIVLIIVAFLFEILSRKNEHNDFHKPSEIMLWSGAFSAVITAIAGYLLSLNGEYSGDSFVFHKWLGLATSLAVMGIVYLSQKHRSHQLFMPLYGFLILLVIITGHFGATLTHGEGFLSEVFEEKQILTLEQNQPFYSQVVSPILDSKCTNCHNANKLKGELILNSQEGIMKGGKSGVVIVAGDVQESILIQNILLPKEEKGHMPPKGKIQLTNEEIKMLTWWVETGASFIQNVENIKNEDPIHTILTNYFTPKEKINIDFVKSNLIASLNSEVMSVYQISENLPYLDVKIERNGDLTVNDLKKLRKIRQQVYSLDLGASNVDNDILNEVSNLENLTRLYLDNTMFNDAMISSLGKMEHLEYLNLYGTKITALGIKKVIEFPQLKQLFLWQSDAELEELKVIQASFPSIEINTGLPEDSDLYVSQLVPPMLVFPSIFFDEPITIEVNYGLPNTNISYQIDDGPSRLVENGKIEINKSSKLRLVAKKDGWEDSHTVEEVFIKVAKTEFKKTQLKNLPKGKYKGNGVTTLFDFIKASKDFADGKWLGFDGDDMIVDIEMDVSQSLSSVYLSSINNLGSWIFPPKVIEIWGGDNKENLVKLTEEKISQPTASDPAELKIYQLKFEPKKIKYLQIRATNFGKLPDWHPGKGNPTWLFVDEIAFD